MSKLTKEQIISFLLKSEKGIVIVGNENNMLAEYAKDMMKEQIGFYVSFVEPDDEWEKLVNSIEFDKPILKEEKPKDWFRKFDNKKRWQK